MTVIAAQVSNGATGLNGGNAKEAPAIGATEANLAGAPGGSTSAASGSTGKLPCSGSGVEHATLIRLLTVRVQSLETNRAAAAPSDYRQPFLPHLREEAQALYQEEHTTHSPTMPARLASASRVRSTRACR